MGDGMNGSNAYKVPNKSSGVVKSPTAISKDSANPRKKSGGDLRANGNGNKK